jgi:CBS domain-containing protein
MTMLINRTKISQIISRQAISVSPDTILSEAVAIMAASKISCIVVAENNQPLGIFTERDLVRQSHRQSTFSSRPVRDVMTSPVITIPGTLSVYEANSLMINNKIRHHIVVDHGGRLLGLMTQSDLINHLGYEDVLQTSKVEEVMTSCVATVSKGIPISEALAAMAGSGISCVVVEENCRPLGILTERDAVRLVAECVDLESVQVGSVMSSPVLTVAIGTTVHSAATLMKMERIRRVVVIDENGHIAGLITQSDIVRGLEGIGQASH